MKARLLFTVAVLPALSGCREGRAAGNPVPLQAQEVASPRQEETLRTAVENAKAERDEAVTAVEKLKAEERRLKADLATLRQMRDNLAKDLRGIDAEKAKVAEEIATFQKKWNAEIDGFEGGIDRPLIEVYRELLEGQDKARLQNRELREKLRAYEATPGTR
jgi:chromosome segregation ATPase